MMTTNTDTMIDILNRKYAGTTFKTAPYPKWGDSAYTWGDPVCIVEIDSFVMRGKDCIMRYRYATEEPCAARQKYMALSLLWELEGFLKRLTKYFNVVMYAEWLGLAENLGDMITIIESCEYNLVNCPRAAAIYDMLFSALDEHTSFIRQYYGFISPFSSYAYIRNWVATSDKS